MGFMVPLAVAGLALSAAGTAYNYKQKKDQAKDIERIQEKAKKKIDANTAQATGRWEEALAAVTPEAQQALKDENAAKRMAEFEEDTAGVADATNVMQGEGAPAIIKSEAAKQLGDKLAVMKSQMQARSRLGGWDDRGIQTGITLGRTGQDIAQLGNFSAGTQQQADRDAAIRASKKSMLGDILVGAGALMSMGAGAAGAAPAAGAAASGAAAGAGAAGAGAAGAGAAGASSAGLGSMLWSNLPWLVTPINTWSMWDSQKQQPQPGKPMDIGYRY